MVKCCIDGRQLQKLRKQVGLSEHELGRLLCIPYTTVLAIERNQPTAIENLSLQLVQNFGRTCLRRVNSPIFAFLQTSLKKLIGLSE